MWTESNTHLSEKDRLKVEWVQSALTEHYTVFRAGNDISNVTIFFHSKSELEQIRELRDSCNRVLQEHGTFEDKVKGAVDGTITETASAASESTEATKSPISGTEVNL